MSDHGPATGTPLVETGCCGCRVHPAQCVSVQAAAVAPRLRLLDADRLHFCQSRDRQLRWLPPAACAVLSFCVTSCCVVLCCAVCSYWDQIAELERRYAADIQELQQRLQSQASSANREKVQTYIERTRKVGAWLC